MNKKYLFQIICFDPSYGLRKYLKLKQHSTFLTSGRLSIDLTENLLKIKFFEKLNNEHVVNRNKFKINIMKEYQIPCLSEK